MHARRATRSSHSSRLATCLTLRRILLMTRSRCSEEVFCGERINHPWLTTTNFPGTRHHGRAVRRLPLAQRENRDARRSRHSASSASRASAKKRQFERPDFARFRARRKCPSSPSSPERDSYRKIVCVVVAAAGRNAPNVSQRHTSQIR